jgi:hypothetical protein
VADKVNAKLQSVLERNPGYSTLCKVSDILCGNEAEVGGNEQQLSANDLTLFKDSPVTSCYVERNFSRHKVPLSDNRRAFHFDSCTSPSTATLPKTKAKLRYEFYIIVKSK